MSMQLGSRYELLEMLGRGGSGQVWSATSPDGPVAVKVLRPELSEDPEIVDRFIAERRLLTGLHSPHIVGVRDLVIEGDRLAIVMDLVTGGDLRSHLREAKTLPPREALDTMAQALDGLAAVHEAGVIHRDLKPENILLASGDGPNRVRVADFGIARLSSTTRTTRTTGLVGTPRYIAPELAIRGQVSPAVDVYAAGVTLYELLFGRVPFDGPHPAAVLRAQAEDLPHRPDRVPDKLWAAIAAMLEKNPADRPTAGEAAEHLRKLSDSLAKLPAFAALPPSLGSDTDDTHTTDPHDNATDATGIGRRGVPQPGPGTSPTVTRKRSRLVAAIAIALVLGLLGGIMLFQSRDTAGALPFRVEDTSQGSLAVNHHWSFASKGGDRIDGTMTVAPSRGHTINKTTTALAVFPASLSHVTFDPNHPINHYPSVTAGKSAPRAGITVAQFRIRKGSSETTFHYHVTVPPGTTSTTRFDPWAEELRTVASSFCAATDPPKICGKSDHLVKLEFTNPLAPPLEMLGTFPAAPLIHGRTTHGSTLTAKQLHGITWKSLNPETANINPTNGIITGLTPGTALITATLGNLTTTTPLWITINPTPPTPTPTQPQHGTTTTTTACCQPPPACGASCPPPCVTSCPPPPSGRATCGPSTTKTVAVNQWASIGATIPMTIDLGCNLPASARVVTAPTAATMYFDAISGSNSNDDIAVNLIGFPSGPGECCQSYVAIGNPIPTSDAWPVDPTNPAAINTFRLGVINLTLNAGTGFTSSPGSDVKVHIASVKLLVVYAM